MRFFLSVSEKGQVEPLRISFINVVYLPPKIQINKLVIHHTISSVFNLSEKARKMFGYCTIKKKNFITSKFIRNKQETVTTFNYTNGGPLDSLSSFSFLYLSPKRSF